MFLFIIPPTFKIIDKVKIPYHMLSGGLKTIDVIESDYKFSNGPESNTIEFELSLRNYGNEVKDFNISIDLPQNLEKMVEENPIMLPQKYSIENQRNILRIKESIQFNYDDGYSREDLFGSDYFYDDYKIIISKEDDELEIVQRGD